MVPVKSSAIEAVGYDAQSRDLTVRYRGGGEYIFHGVSPELHQKLGEADSLGKFINAEIKGKHPHSKA